MTSAAPLAFLALLVPLAFFLVRLLPASKPAATIFALCGALVLGAFLFLHPHEDAFSGLDNAAYGNMAAAFSQGRPLVSHDQKAGTLPKVVAQSFLYRSPFSKLRPTLDCAFQTSRDFSTSRPFYLPAYSLAKAGSHLGKIFMPLLGTLWLLTLFLSSCRKAGFAGLATATALAMATAYPAWFFRGDFAEGAAAILATSVFLSASGRRFENGWEFITAAFALGYSLSFHLTALLVAVPVAIVLLPDARRLRERAAFAVGAILGFAPLWLVTRYVTAPYGDWTRLLNLKRIATAAPEHAALFAGAAILLVAAIVAFASIGSTCLRGFALRADRFLTPWGWTSAALMPGLALFLVSRLLPSCGMNQGAASSVWLSLRTPALLLGLLGSTALLRRDMRPANRLLWMLTLWVASVFFLVKSFEYPVGIWSFRRLLPPVLMFIAAAAIPLAEMLATARNTRIKAALAATLAVAALANPIRFPLAYAGVNGKGSETSIAMIEHFLADYGDPTVIFDYFPHALPFSANPRHTVFGLGEHARGKWGEVANWISKTAQTGTVYIASSYTPPLLEEGFVLEPICQFKFEIGEIASKHFFPAARRSRHIGNSFSAALPLEKIPHEKLCQHIVFDGSPIGLRGDWCFNRNGGAWSRASSSLVGPLPSPGTNVTFILDVSWTPPVETMSNQVIRLDFPGNNYLTLLTIGAGRHKIETTLVSEKPLPRVGLYSITAPRPYNPAEYGIKGYPQDLGAFFHAIEIKPTPAGD